MSALVTGLLGVAINAAPSLFKLLAADRDGGEVREQTIEIVKRVVETDDEAEANRKIQQDPQVATKLRKELAALEVLALEEQQRADEEQRRIDLAFLELESAERQQAQKEQIDLLNADLKSAQAARDSALEMSKSQRWWVAGINPFLSLVITGGFIGSLYLMMKLPKIENVEVFYTAIGALATGFATVVGFHFGSSSGSKEKDEMVIGAPSQQESQADGASADDVGTVAGVHADGPASAPIAPEKPKAKPPLPDPGGTFGLFRQKAPNIMQDLMTDFGLTLDQAAGVLGNIGHECAGFRKMQEIKPIIPGSRGGWGWCQWTGPRRRAFEAWCTRHGFDNLSADEANYGFLSHELETTEKRALSHLRRTVSLGDATESFMEKFERPGIEHLDSRINWAREALRASRDSMS